MKITPFVLAAASFYALLTWPAQALSIIDNTGVDDGNVFPFGAANPATTTYGQQLLNLSGPDTHISSFSLFLRDRIGAGSGTLDLRGYVAEWDGLKASNILYESTTRTMNAAGTLQEFVFMPGLNLNAGSDYVFFLSISNLPVQPMSTFNMPISNNTIGNGDFVFLNNDNDFSLLTTTNWGVGVQNPFTRDVWIKATFTEAQVTQAPEPGTMAIFGIGLAGLGIARRKRAA